MAQMFSGRAFVYIPLLRTFAALLDVPPKETIDTLTTDTRQIQMVLKHALRFHTLSTC